MLMIRLQRVGRRNHAEFRLVATEKSRAAKSSNYVEHLGHYNPHTDTVSFNTERVLYWIENGAQVSDTVHNLLVSEGIIKGEKKNVLPKKSPIKNEEASAAEQSEGDTEASEEQTEEETSEEKEPETKEATAKDKTEAEGSDSAEASTDKEK